MIDGQVLSTKNLAPQKVKGRTRRVNQAEFDVVVHFEPITS